MVKKFILPIILVLFPFFSEAKEAPVDVVKNFGEVLATWCRTGDITNREKLEQLCNGVKKCRVEDKIHADYQAKRGLCDYNTFVLESYLNMYESIMPNGLSFQMSDIKTETQDNMPEGQTLTFITATIRLSGKINCEVKDLFLVRDDKISGIYSYSSQLGFSHLNGSLIKALTIGRYTTSELGFLNGYAVILNEIGKSGLIDTKGNVIIPCIWDEIYYFGGSFATGTDGNLEVMKTYDLRFNGKIIPVNYFADGVTSNCFHDGFMIVASTKGKYGFLKENDKKYTINYKYDVATNFHKGYAFVILDGTECIVDESLNPKYKSNNEYEICSTFYEGLAKIKNKRTQKVGFLDTNGEIKIPCVYDDADEFSEDLCCVYKSDKYGYINKNGNMVIPLSFNPNDGRNVIWNRKFIQGSVDITQIKNNKMYGTLIGKNGKPLPGFDWQYKQVNRFSENFALFYTHNGKVGFLNKNGNIVIQPLYESALDFTNGYASVARYINGKLKWGCINKDGIQTVPFIYDDAFHFENGIALVELEGKIGLIDTYGNSSFSTR